MSPDLPEWIDDNRLAVGLIGAAVLISVILVIGANSGSLVAPSNGAPNETGTQDDGENFTEFPDSDDDKVQSGSQGAEVQAVTNITMWGVNPSKTTIDIGNAVRFDNKADNAIIIDWRDTDSENITVDAGGSYTARFRGFEYFTIYSAVDDAEGGWPLKGFVDASS